MTKSLIAPDMTHSFFDDSNTALMAVWPSGAHQRYFDDLPEASVSSTLSRRIMPELPDDKDEPASSVPVTKKKVDVSSTSDDRGAPKKTTPTKKAEPLPPSENTPAKKSRDESVKIKKNLPSADPSPSVSSTKKDKVPESSTPVSSAVSSKKPVSVAVPVKKDFQTGDGDTNNFSSGSGGKKLDKILPPQVKDKTPELSSSGSNEIPPEPPLIDSVSLPPEPGPEPVPQAGGVENSAGISPVAVPEEKYAEEPIPDTLIADMESTESNLLTEDSADVFMGERMNTNGSKSIFSTIGEFFTDLMGYNFSDKAADESDVPAYVPVVFPPPRNPKSETDPIESFRAGYISQRDLEGALGRDDWTMCCAATFVYAVQSKYPGLDRDEILAAAEEAANTPLADDSGNCVDDDGYIPSVYQYSQALSKNLGLKDYIDVSGQYPSIESAREAGAGMMKVELSGTIDYKQQEHHIFQLGRGVIDPIPDGGIDQFLDPGSKKVVNVMAMNWYSLP